MKEIKAFFKNNFVAQADRVKTIFDQTKKIFTGEELLNRGIVEIPCLISKILPSVGVACFGGSSDTGKSSLLRHLAISIVLGLDYWVGFRINAKFNNVIYVSSEDDEMAISYLLGKQNKGLGYTGINYKNLRYIFDTENILETLDRALTESKADLIIIDTFSDIFSGDMNTANKIRSFINPFSILANKHQCLIIFLHHTSKNAEDKIPSKHNLLGSQGFESKMRLVIELRRDLVRPDVRHLCIVKGNYLGNEFKEESFELLFDENMNFTNLNRRTAFKHLIKNSDEESLALINSAQQMRDNKITIKEISEKLNRSTGWVSQVTTSRK